MAGLLARRLSALSATEPLLEERYSMTDWIRWTTAGGSHHFVTSALSRADFATAIESSPAVSAAVTKRARVFSEVRFAWQRVQNGRPGDLFTDRSLALLESPSPHMSLAQLLSLWEFDVSAAGNAYGYLAGDRIEVPDPASVTLVSELRTMPDGTPYGELLGYEIEVAHGVYHTVLPEDMAHMRGLPSPHSRWLGRSWIGAVHAEVVGDDLLTRARRQFFENAATPNLIVTSPGELSDEQFSRLQQMIERRHAGSANAGRTLLLENGGDATVVGADLSRSDGGLQDAYESRIAMASEVPAPVLGVMLGMNPTYNNYSTALRAFVDLWARPAWRDASSALARLVRSPGDGVRLWYDDRDVAALRSDVAAQADIRSKDAQTARTLVDGGYDPASVSAFLVSGDPNDLVHSGLVSVQMQPPGSGLDAGGKSE